jgi:hypothetical protein
VWQQQSTIQLLLDLVHAASLKGDGIMLEWIHRIPAVNMVLGDIMQKVGPEA